MKFRSAILLGVFLLVVGVVAAAMASVVVVLDDAAKKTLAEDLARGRDVLAEKLADRQAAMRSEARVVAEEPRLKAVTAAEEVSRDTLVGVAHELKKAVASDLFLLTDQDGALLIDLAHEEDSGFDLSRKAPVRQALDKGDGAAVWTDGGRAYQVQGHRLAFGEQVVGVLLTGRVVDDAALEAVRRQTGGSVVLLLDGKPIARSAFATQLDVAPDAATLGSALAGLKPGGAPAEVMLGGARHLGIAMELPGYAGERKLSAVLLRSLDAALAPARRLTHVLGAITVVALAAALLFALALSRRLARPLDALVGFTKKVASGELSARAADAGPTEVRSLAEAMNRMVHELAESRTQLARKERLEREMEIAQRIQTSILPKDLAVPRLEIAARMLPASEVGGDYYDVIPAPGGAWIGIGDVAGHGLPAGLVMLMIQSGIASLGRAHPDAEPSVLLGLLNEVLYDNVRHRLTGDEHVTLSLLRFFEDGRIRYAGAHEEMLLWRKAKNAVERVPTPGTWLGAVRNIRQATVDTALQLEPGDVLLLYTDGVTEAMDAAGEQFGIDRLGDELLALHGEPVERIVAQIEQRVSDWMKQQDDDVTLLVMRYG